MSANEYLDGAIEAIEEVRAEMVRLHGLACAGTWDAAYDHGMGSKEHHRVGGQAEAYGHAVSLLTRALEQITGTPSCATCPNCWPRNTR